MAQGKRNHEGVSRDFLMRYSFIIPLLLLGEVSSALGKSPDTHPNVIFFLVDDLGQCDVACYESTFHKTPAIDQLALDGMLFTDACSTCHVCSPSQDSILTGKYLARLNLTDWLQRANRVNALPLSEITHAQTFQQYTQKNKPISSSQRVQKFEAFYLPLGRHKNSQ